MSEREIIDRIIESEMRDQRMLMNALRRAEKSVEEGDLTAEIPKELLEK